MWLVGTGIFSIAVAGTSLWALSDCTLQLATTFYGEKIREPMFSGLLTVAAFLFSLQTFIVVTMKENVYDSTKYDDLIKKLRVVKPTLKRYAPLQNFSSLLFQAVLTSLVAAVFQFSIGLIESPVAAAASIAMALWAILMNFVALFYLQSNLKIWFGFLD